MSTFHVQEYCFPEAIHTIYKLHVMMTLADILIHGYLSGVDYIFSLHLSLP